jgi:DNA-binding transcriptional ArsR family regulator
MTAEARLELIEKQSDAERMAEFCHLLGKAFVLGQMRAIEAPVPAPGGPLSGSPAVADETDVRILDLLRRFGPTAPRVLCQELKMPRATMTRRLARLSGSGVIAVQGQTRSARYRICE